MPNSQSAEREFRPETEAGGYPELAVSLPLLDLEKAPERIINVLKKIRQAALGV
jgi:hypothetical protein